VVVTINYLDDFQQPQTITQELTVEVETAPLTPESDARPGVRPGSTEGALDGNIGQLTLGQRLWRMLLGFFGIATQRVGGSAGGAIPQVPGGVTP
jgi:hypothetical protein